MEFQLTYQQTFIALGKTKISLFLAEPISDIIAATITSAMFFYTFSKMLKSVAKSARPR